MSVGITELISGIFKPAAELIDNLHTSTEEKLEQKRLLLEVQGRAMDRVHEYNTALLEGQSKIINSEAQSEHWVTATWRPIVMLGLFSLVMLDSFGWLPNRLSDEAWLLLQIGLGGYVVGRSVEKGVKTYREKPNV
jgi:hypothetical protein